MSGARWARVHLVATFVWAALAVPTVLLWSRSVLWIGLISVYANVVTHISAWQAARVERKQDDPDA